MMERSTAAEVQARVGVVTGPDQCDSRSPYTDERCMHRENHGACHARWTPGSAKKTDERWW